MSAAAPRLDAVTADAACRFRSGKRKTELLLHRACQNPRTLCCGQPVACIISAMLAPSA